MTKKSRTRPAPPVSLDKEDPIELSFSVSREREATNLFQFSAVLSVFVGEDEPEETLELHEVNDDGLAAVGHAFGAYVPYVNSAEELVDLGDMISDDLFSLVELPWKDGELKLEGSNDYEMPYTTWLGVDQIEIKPAWRGHELGYFAMREIVRLFASQVDVLITIKPHPIMTDEARKEPRSVIEAGQKKLCRYWERFGFKRIGETQIYAHDGRRQWPKGSWMARHKS